MRVLAFIAGFGSLYIVLLDAFQTIILPRRASGRFRLTRLFYLMTWKPWTFATRYCTAISPSTRPRPLVVHRLRAVIERQEGTVRTAARFQFRARAATRSQPGGSATGANGISATATTGQCP